MCKTHESWNILKKFNINHRYKYKAERAQETANWAKYYTSRKT